MSNVVGAGVVTIIADDTKFQSALQRMPGIARTQIDLTMRQIQAQMDRVQLRISMGAPNTIQLTNQLDMLDRRLNQVKLNAIKMGDGFGVGGSRGAQALYQLGAAADDAQYGIRGVLNNIPQIAIALGNPAIAGGLAILVTLAYQLYTNFNRIKDALGELRIDSHAKQMEVFAEQAKNAANEMERIAAARGKDKLEEIDKEGQKVLEKTGKHEDKARQRIEEAIGEANAEDTGSVYRGIRTEFQHDIEQDADVVKHKMRVKGLENAPTVAGDRLRGIDVWKYETKILTTKTEAIENAKQDLEAARLKAAEAIAGKAKLGIGDSRKKLQEAVKRNPQAFGPGGGKLAGELYHATPEMVKEDEEQEASEKAQAKVDAHTNKAKQHAITLRKNIGNTLRRFGQAAKRKIAAQARKNAAEQKRKDRARTKQIMEIATPLAKGDIGRKLLRNPKADINQDVYRRLRAQGYSEKKATEMIGDVAGNTRSKVEGMVADRVNKFGGTNEEARKFLADKADADERKKVDARKRQVREVGERVEDAQERVHDSREKVRKAFMGNQKSQVMGIQEFLNSQLTGSLNGEDRQREYVEALKDAAKAERELKDAIQNKKDVIANAAP